MNDRRTATTVHLRLITSRVQLWLMWSSRLWDDGSAVNFGFARTPLHPKVRGRTEQKVLDFGFAQITTRMWCHKEERFIPVLRVSGPVHAVPCLTFNAHLSYKTWSDFLFLKHACSILRQSSNPVCGFSMMERVRLCAVWPTENWLGSSMNHIQGWMIVLECCRHALEKGCLDVVHSLGIFEKCLCSPVSLHRPSHPHVTQFNPHVLNVQHHF